jgi:hypothetical protein
MARRKGNAQATQAVFEVTEPHAVDVAGVSWVLRRGERVGGDHPALAANRSFFREAGAATVDTERKAIKADPSEEAPPKPKPPRSRSMVP